MQKLTNRKILDSDNQMQHKSYRIRETNQKRKQTKPLLKRKEKEHENM